MRRHHRYRSPGQCCSSAADVEREDTTIVCARLLSAAADPQCFRSPVDCYDRSSELGALISATNAHFRFRFRFQYQQICFQSTRSAAESQQEKALSSTGGTGQNR